MSIMGPVEGRLAGWLLLALMLMPVSFPEGDTLRPPPLLYPFSAVRACP